MRKLIVIAVLAGTPAVLPPAEAGVIRFAAKESAKAVKSSAHIAKKAAGRAWKIAY